MALIRWEPARELQTLQHEVNRLFGSFFDTPTPTANGGTAPRRWIPAMDLVESGEQYVLRADLPGLTEDDVKIEFEDNVLTVSGERRSEHEERSKGYARLERAFGSFTRSLTLPSGTDASAIEASFADGVLEVRIPKPTQRKPHRVAIATGAPRTLEGAESEPAAQTPTPAA